MSNDEDKLRFSLPVRVYCGDTNAGGVVYYADHLKFMERARIEWLRSLDFELDALRRGGLLLTVRHEVRRAADATLCCRGRIKSACVDAKTLRPKRIPERLLAEIADVR